MSKSGFDNVHFLGVARVAGQGIVVASFDHNSEKQTEFKKCSTHENDDSKIWIKVSL